MISATCSRAWNIVARLGRPADRVPPFPGHDPIVTENLSAAPVLRFDAYALPWHLQPSRSFVEYRGAKFRHREQPGRANARPMTSSAKQSKISNRG